MIMGPGLGLLNRRRRAAAASYPLLNNLVAYWNLSEASGQRNDSHTNALHLTDNNTVTSATGPDGGTAASFAAASSEYLSRAHDANVTVNGSDFTLAAWIRLADKSAARTLIAKRIGTNGEFAFAYDNASDRIGFYPMPAGGGAGTWIAADNYGSPATGTWLFCVAWWDEAARTGYVSINNGAANSANVGFGIGTFPTPFTIGAQREPTLFFMNGRIAYVGFWKRVLTAAERTWLYNVGAGRNYAAVAAYTG